jgi:hypothetical protein
MNWVRIREYVYPKGNAPSRQRKGKTITLGKKCLQHWRKLPLNLKARE